MLASFKRITKHCNLGDFYMHALPFKKSVVWETPPLEKAQTIAIAMELSTKNAIEIQRYSETPSPVQDQQQAGFRVNETTQSCLSCRKTVHKGRNCRFYSSRCHECSKHGHIAVVCYSVPRKEVSAPNINNAHCFKEEHTGIGRHWWQRVLHFQV